MKLWCSPTSPFSRKVRMAAIELHLPDDTFELVEVDPWTDPRVRGLNPLGKVPTVQLDDGGVLYESAVIVEYINTVVMGGLIPPLGRSRWTTLRMQGLCDSVAAAAGRLFAAEQRDAPDPIEERLVETIQAGLNAIERERLDYERPLVGDIAAAVTLAYFDFRWPDRDWRSGRPRSAEFLDQMQRRPSMIETAYRPLAQGDAAGD
jgi:glutathione S-transferase